MDVEATFCARKIHYDGGPDLVRFVLLFTYVCMNANTLSSDISGSFSPNSWLL